MGEIVTATQLLALTGKLRKLAAAATLGPDLSACAFAMLVLTSGDHTFDPARKVQGEA